jgi:hypothetical protein
MNKLLTLTLVAGSALALTACGGGGSGGIGDALNLSSPSLRLINVDPATTDGLVLYRNGAQQTDAGAPTYEENSNYFETVDSTTSTWSVNDSVTGAVLGSTSVTTDGSTRYTLLAFPGTTNAVDLVTVTDPYDVSVTNDNGRMRIVNGSPNSDAFDVYLTAPGADITTATPQMIDVTYENAMPASGSNSYSLGAGTYEIRLTTTGTKNVFFDSSLTTGTNDDLMLISLPNSSAGDDVKLLDVVSGNPAYEITNQMMGS